MRTFLGRVAGRAPLVIEIKSRFDNDPRLTHRTVDVVSGYKGPVALKSFDPFVVAAIRTTAPQIPRGIVAESAYEGDEWEKLSRDQRHDMANLLHFGATEPDFLSWRVARPALRRAVPVPAPQAHAGDGLDGAHRAGPAPRGAPRRPDGVRGVQARSCSGRGRGLTVEATGCRAPQLSSC